MAEEYAEKHSFRVPYDGSNKFYDDTDFKASKDGFLAGLKAGRPQWHDLRKDPNDLPPKMVSNHNFSIEVLSDRGEIVCYNFHYCEWFYWRSGEPIAWCEIPTFDVARCELVIKKGNW